jgi:hypothetical protein
MGLIQQIQCDIDGCAETAAFTGVETGVKVEQASPSIKIAKLDLCSKHRQELMNLMPIVSTNNVFKFAHTNATR